ncbi:MAG: hypothetical protein QOD77_1433 [Thermoplasmata archaeon]|jgi:hypothetical protein|nr:hypothetical protein [Thermoplasmata archaeon]
MSELENRYSALFGTKTSKGQLQAGFFLLGLGVLLGLAALTLFFISLGQPATDQIAWRRVALPLGALSLPSLFLGITVALPTKTGLRVASWAGFSATLMATILFVVHYPNEIFVSARGGKTDYAWLDVGLFVIGLGFMLAAIISSVVGYYLGRLQGTATKESEDDDEAYGPGYEVPDWVVERDIEYAMKKFGVELVGSSANSSAMKVNIPDSLGAGAVIGGLGKARVVQVDAAQVDEGVAQLSGVRPNKRGALPGEWADESTRALIAFRKQKAANPTLYTPKVGFWRRFWNALTGRNKPAAAATRAAPAAPAAPARNGKAPADTAAKVAKAASLPKRGSTVVIEDEQPLPKVKKGGSN